MQDANSTSDFLEKKIYYLNMIGDIIVQTVELCREYDKMSPEPCTPHPVEILSSNEIVTVARDYRALNYTAS